MIKNYRLLLFGFFLVVYTLAGFSLAYGLQIYHNDAIARTALGFFTIFGRDPHLGAIGFVWQPLPSLLQLPLLTLLRPLGFQMLAGPLIGAVFGAATVVSIFDISQLIDKKSHTKICVLIAALYGLNPMTVLYAALGSSETIFIGSLLFYSYFQLKWVLKKKQSDLVIASFFLALSFGSRYESVAAYLAGIFLVILIHVIRKNPFHKVESSLIQLCLPFLYVVGLWILANWAIMGNPFYFLNSPYSNPSFTNVVKENPAAMEFSYYSLIGSSMYAAKRVTLLAPGLFLLPVAYLSFRNGSPAKVKANLSVFISLLAPYLAIIGFHVYQLFKGESLGWLRFFSYSLVAATLLAIYLAKKQPRLIAIILLLLGLGLGSSAYAMSNSQFGKEENSFARKIANPSVELDYSRTYRDQKAVAKYMDRLPGRVILDTDAGFAIPLFATEPSRYIITSDIDFVEMVQDYHPNADWVIVPKPNADNIKKNIVFQHHPDIWSNTIHDLKLYTEVEGWGIFAVQK